MRASVPAQVCDGTAASRVSISVGGQSFENGVTRSTKDRVVFVWLTKYWAMGCAMR